MKRKLTRASIDELKKEMPVLSVEQQNEIIGGGTIFYLDSSGHWWGSGFAYGNNDYIDINGKQFAASGGLNLTLSSKGLEITGAGVGQNLENFIKQNTKVEWAFSCNKHASDSNGTLNTSYMEDHVNYDAYTHYDTQVQTHPYNNIPSEEDYKAKEKLQENGYENFYIHYGSEYYSF